MRNITLLLFLVCSVALTAFAAHQPGLSSVSLKVTVNTSQQFNPLAGTATDVSSDGYGQYYIDGQTGVCASFDTQGDLIINFACTSASTPRQLGLNLGASLSLTGKCAPPLTISPSVSGPYTNYISTVPATSPTNTAAFQKMAIYDGTASTIFYVQFFIGTQLSDANQTDYRLNYHRTTSSPFPSDAALASYAEVRRMSNTQWVVESVTPSTLNGDPNVAMLVSVTSTHNQSTTTECGFYQVPFSFTLDQQ